MASEATHDDARLLLELYNLRREKVLRRARDFVQKDLKFKDFKDYTKKYPDGSKQGTYVAMVTGYWDMACTLVEKGLLNEDLFNATTFEHVGVWMKLRPLVDGWRKKYHYPQLMRAMETVANRHPGMAAFEQAANPKAKGKKSDGGSKGKKSQPEKPPAP
jgi:hypothetical protein